MHVNEGFNEAVFFFKKRAWVELQEYTVSVVSDHALIVSTCARSTVLFYISAKPQLNNINQYEISNYFDPIIVYEA